MTFLINPFLGSVGAAKTEADWKAHLLTITPQGDALWVQMNTSATPELVGNYRMVAAAATAGRLYGTAHLEHFTNDSFGDKMVRHALPDQATFDDQVASSRHMQVAFTNPGDQTVFNSVTRNGYTSFAYALESPARRCTLIRWWDPVQLKVLQRNPFTNSSTTEYTW